jgi:serine phosphatase RsbU (regulator of sigma subunit)
MKKNKFIVWLILLLVFGGLPIVMSFFTTLYFYTEEQKENIQYFSDKANNAFNELSVACKPKVFWARVLQRSFTESKNIKELAKKIRKIKTRTKSNFSYFILNKNGEIFFKTNKNSPKNCDYKMVFNTLFKRIIRGKKTKDRNFSKKEIKNIKKLLGKNFFLDYVSQAFAGVAPYLLQTEASIRKPLIWVNVNKEFGLFVFFKHSDLTLMKTLSASLKCYNFAKKYPLISFAVGCERKNLISDPKYRSLFKQNWSRFLSSGSGDLICKDEVVFFRQLSNSIVSIGIIKNDNLHKWQTYIIICFFWAISLLICYITANKSYAFVLQKKDSNLSLGKQLALMFAYSNLIPALILGYFASSYLGQLKKVSLQKFTQAGIKYLKHIDELHKVEYVANKRKLKAFLNKIKKDIYKGHFDNLKTNFQNNWIAGGKAFFIASNSNNIITNEGIFLQNKPSRLFDSSRKQAVLENQEKKIISLLGKCFLAHHNRQKLKIKTETEIEMGIDALGLKTKSHFLQNFYENMGIIWKWGFGSKQYPIFLAVFHQSEKLLDYFCLFILDIFQFQINYAKKIEFFQQTNPSPFKIIVSMGVFDLFFPEKYGKYGKFGEYKELKKFASLLELEAGTNSTKFKIDGIDFHFLGIKGNHANHLSFIAYFPASLIDQITNKRKRDFFVLAFLSFVGIALLGTMTLHILIIPIEELSKGISAMENMDYAYQIKNLGRNEFGELAQIFNTTIQELEELNTAKIVQEKLLATLAEKKQIGNFQVYGKTFSLNEVGGDYFDIIEWQKTNQAGIILGDVAGHGIGAALIMAFIKSCVLQYPQYYQTPEKLVEALNFSLKKIRNRRQTRFMTFQYLLLDGDSNTISIENAGHTYPASVDINNKEVEFIKVAGTPLGVRKKYLSNLKEIKVENGQAIVLYTDGLYEATAKDGKEIGFDRLETLILESYKQDPKDYFHNLLNAFKELTDESDLNDDLTLIIICSNKLARDN